MQTVRVALEERSYPIYIGDGLLGTPGLLRDKLSGRQALVVTNTCVAPLYLDRVLSQLEGVAVDTLVLPDGEAHKTLASYITILETLLEKRHNRTTTVIALGGGVVGDMAGFAAATYQRGVGFVQIPTTLLAQVDSSVGGKTAVNHPLGKNMIGAFYQPQCVLADVGTLATLPVRELRAGLAEVIKYGVICDAELFNWLENNTQALLQLDRDALTHAVKRSCEIKAQVVSEDERESGRRAILNFGHTFGHAFENLLGYGTMLHGEAVAAGMVSAMQLSADLGMCSRSDAERVRYLVQAFGLPVRPSGVLSGSAVVQAMGMDKKVIDGTLRLILARSVGSVDVVAGVGEASITAALRTLGAVRDE